MSAITKLGQTAVYDFPTHDPSDGSLSDADFLPTCKVFEDDTDTAIFSPTVVKRIGHTGCYRVLVAATALNGFEVGKTYNVHVNATVNGIPAEAVLDTFLLGENDLDDLAEAIAAVATTGTGLRTVTVTVQNGDGDLLEGVAVSITNQAETSDIAGPQKTDENGEVVFNLDDGTDYRAIPRTTKTLSAGATNFTVSGATAVTCVMTEAALPAPVPADCYVLWCNETDEHDDPVGADDVVVQVMGMTETAQVDGAAQAMRGILNIEHPTNAAGQWSFAIGKALNGAGLAIKKSYTDAGGHRVEEEWEATIDEHEADLDDLMPWAALSPRKI